MGLGGAPGEWADLEWFRFSDVATAAAPGAGLAERAADVELWADGAGTRVLLVDLDNLRAGPRRLRERIGLMARLAETADVVALAGQEGAVERARGSLGRYAREARVASNAPDAADRLLLAAADAVPDGPAQFVVASNDGIFATLAERGRLVVLSPGEEALSDRLTDAAALVVDLVAWEEGASVPAPAVPPAGRVRPGRSRRAATGPRRGRASTARARG